MTSGAHRGRWWRPNRRAFHARVERGELCCARGGAVGLHGEGRAGPMTGPRERRGRLGRRASRPKGKEGRRGGGGWAAPESRPNREGGSVLFSISYLAIIFY
jgi:hypothetical protein